MLNRLGSSSNRGRGGFDLGRVVGLLDLLLLGLFDRRGSGISSRILKGSNRSGLLNLWGSLVDLGGVVGLLRLRLEKLADTRGQTATDLDRRPDGPLLFLFFLVLLLLGLLGRGFRDRLLRFNGSRGLCLLNWLGGSYLDGGLRSGGLLGLDISRGRLFSGSREFLGDRRRRLKQSVHRNKRKYGNQQTSSFFLSFFGTFSFTFFSTLAFSFLRPPKSLERKPGLLGLSSFLAEASA